MGLWGIRSPFFVFVEILTTARDELRFSPLAFVCVSVCVLFECLKRRHARAQEKEEGESKTAMTNSHVCWKSGGLPCQRRKKYDLSARGFSPLDFLSSSLSATSCYPCARRQVQPQNAKAPNDRHRCRRFTTGPKV